MTPYNWTPEKLARFKLALKAAENRRRETFTFDGHTFYVGYAQYLVQYLDQEFNSKP